MHQAEITLNTKAEVTPERLKALVEKFAEFGVSQEQIEKYIQRRIDAITPALLVRLGKIYNSIKEGMSKPADWFEAPRHRSDRRTPADADLRGEREAKARAAKRKPAHRLRHRACSRGSQRPRAHHRRGHRPEAHREREGRGEEAAQVLDLCIGQTFYPRIVEAFNGQWADKV
jgi:hypothetical protein